ncbi:MAG: hypothetical protein VXW32_14800, partial [Myxococcota bacterium]|nr:hypothetical protein [Myxococcota bacterium]
MNGKIRPNGGPQTIPGLHLSTRLPGLVQRLRGVELDQLASRIDPDSPSQIAEVGRNHQSEANRIQREKAEFEKAIREATTSQARKEVTFRQLSRPEFSGFAASKKDRGLWFDAEALTSLYNRQIDEHGVMLELCSRLLAGLDLNSSAVKFLQSLLPDPRLPTRREAAKTLAEWCITQQANGSMDTLLAENLLETARQRGQDPLTARHCFLVLSVLGPAADGAFAEILPDATSSTFSAVVRCQAIRMAMLGGASRQDWAWTRGRLDPSEQVRCALVEALAAEGGLVSLERMSSLSRRDPAPSVRKRAQILLEQREAPGSHQQTFETSAEMSAVVADCSDLNCGESLVTSLPGSESPMDFAVALLEAASQGFGFAIAPTSKGRIRITRGDQRVLRFWRVFHELRNPLPGKRLLGDHLSGRAHPGPIRVEGDVLGERYPTGVPNQPEHISDSLGTAPWLPLPEAALEAADWGSILVVTAQGVTSLHAPQSSLARIWAQMRISTSMSTLTKKRSQALRSESPEEKRQYVRELEGLGYRMEFQPHPEQVSPIAGVEQYFGVAAPPALIGANSPTDLAVVASAIGAYTLYKLRSSRQDIKRTRASIP